jgi:undecaprenyl-diphosphatase
MDGQGQDAFSKPLASCLAPLALSCLALLLAFIGLFEWDAPITRFVRSLYHPIGYLPNPWLAGLSNRGDQLGSGESLIVLSLVFLVVGFGLKQALWKTVGWQTLVAHGIAALACNALKHLIGRARPKFMHAGNVEFMPVGGSGWDSFPSGHATASFAVAAVLATRFPKLRWIVLGLSAVIATSRILRGSHFLTDAAGGAVLGYTIGIVVAHPWREWRSSITAALLTVTPFLAGLLALIWTIGRQATDLWPAAQLIMSGMLLTMAGLVGDILRTIRGGNAPIWLSKRLTHALIGVGLGMATGSLWVTLAVGCSCAARWLQMHDTEEQSIEEQRGDSSVLAREAAFSLLVLLALLATVELRGALPML